MKKYLTLLLVCLLQLSTFAFSQKATASLDTNTISIGEQTKLHLSIQFVAGQKVSFAQLEDSLTKYIQIVDKSGIDTSYAEKNVAVKTLSQELTITSFDSGYHPIPPILFYVDGDSVRTEPILLTVNTVVIPDNADIKDIKDILDVTFSIWDWILLNKWYILSAIALIALTLLGIYFYRKYKKRPKAKFVKAKPLEPAHEIALRKLEELKGKKLWQQSKVKEYHVEISYIIREYLENRYGTNSLDNTTYEILADMRDLEVGEEDRKRLAQVLTLADMAKFAKQEPVSDENEQSMKNAEAFVDSTKKKAEKPTAQTADKTSKTE